MADEIRANLPAGNGERLELRVGSKSIGFTTKDLVSVLLVVVLAGFGYFMAQNLTEGQRKGFDGLAQILEKGSTYHTNNLEKMSANQQVLMDLIHADRLQMMSELNRQNQQVSEQTAHLRNELQAQNRLVHEQSKELRHWLEVVLFNLRHPPEQHLPLDMAPGSLPLPERGR